MMRMDFSEGPYTETVKRRRAIGRNELVLHNHHTKEMQERRAHLISFLKPGEKADSLPKKIWNGARPEKWRRLHPDLPSYTILAQMHRDLSEWVHPKLERWITVREAARLQSFHDGFIFKSSEWQMLKQIGNAVPPLLAHAAGCMAISVLNALDGKIENLSVPLQQTLPMILPAARKRQSAMAA
jgi:DNA (cytosine-5)-methyltransferase 1